MATVLHFPSTRAPSRRRTPESAGCGATNARPWPTSETAGPAALGLVWFEGVWPFPTHASWKIPRHRSRGQSGLLTPEKCGGTGWNARAEKEGCAERIARCGTLSQNGYGASLPLYSRAFKAPHRRATSARPWPARPPTSTRALRWHGCGRSFFADGHTSWNIPEPIRTPTSSHGRPG